MTPIERAARAMCAEDSKHYTYTWDTISEPHRDLFRRLASAALLALANPEAISDEMVDAFNDAFDNPELPAETTHHRALKIGIAASIRAAAGEKT